MDNMDIVPLINVNYLSHPLWIPSRFVQRFDPGIIFEVIRMGCFLGDRMENQPILRLVITRV